MHAAPTPSTSLTSLLPAERISFRVLASLTEELDLVVCDKHLLTTIMTSWCRYAPRNHSTRVAWHSVVSWFDSDSNLHIFVVRVVGVVWVVLMLTTFRHSQWQRPANNNPSIERSLRIIHLVPLDYATLNWIIIFFTFWIPACLCSAWLLFLSGSIFFLVLSSGCLCCWCFCFSSPHSRGGIQVKQTQCFWVILCRRCVGEVFEQLMEEGGAEETGGATGLADCWNLRGWFNRIFFPFVLRLARVKGNVFSFHENRKVFFLSSGGISLLLLHHPLCSGFPKRCNSPATWYGDRQSGPGTTTASWNATPKTTCQQTNYSICISEYCSLSSYTTQLS